MSGNLGSGLLSRTSCLDLLERVAAAGEELVGAAAGDGERDLRPADSCRAGSASTKAGGTRAAAATPSCRRPVGAASVEGAFGRGLGRAARPDRAGAFQGGPSFGARSEVGDHVAGRFDRAGGIHVDGDFALQVEAGEFVEARLRDRHAIPDEHHRRFDERAMSPRLERMASCAVTGSGLPSRTKFQGGLGDLAGLKTDRLEVAGRPGRLKSELFELCLDVADSGEKAGRSGVAAFELVVGEELDMVPPELALGGIIGGEDRGGGEKDNGAALHFLGVAQGGWAGSDGVRAAPIVVILTEV